MQSKAVATGLLVILLGSTSLAAQGDPPAQQPSDNANPAGAGPQASPPASIRSVTPYRGNVAAQTAHLRQNVHIVVDNYAALEKDASPTTPVTLWINGRDAKLVPEEIVPSGTTAMLNFQLERTADNQDLWKTLLEDPFDPPTRPVTMSVGISGTKPIGEPKQVSLLKTERRRAFWWFMALAVLVIAFCILAWKTAVVRNGPPVLINGTRKQQAYSLGRCQMAWWFFLILVGYVAIWQICGDQDTITTSLLALMGISAGTALGAVAIDVTTQSSARTKLSDEQTAVQQQLADTQAQIAAAGGAAAPAAAALSGTEKKLTDRLADIANELAALDLPALNEFWLLDVLRDDDGTIALHRFQIVVWTIVLGIMFLTSVFTTLTMPQFSTTLLGLMGISSGTYLGFKMPSASS